MLTKEDRHTQYVFLKATWTGEYTEHMINEVNYLTRKELDVFAQEHEMLFLGKINLYNEDTGDLWVYDNVENEPRLYNFGADFAVPVNDRQLVQMITERACTPYTGTARDYPLVTAIIDRVKEIGGILLIWA